MDAYYNIVLVHKEGLDIPEKSQLKELHYRARAAKTGNMSPLYALGVAEMEEDQADPAIKY